MSQPLVKFCKPKCKPNTPIGIFFLYTVSRVVNDIFWGKIVNDILNRFSKWFYRIKFLRYR